MALLYGPAQALNRPCRRFPARAAPELVAACRFLLRQANRPGMSPGALAVRLQPLGFDEGHISSVMAAVKAMAQSDGGPVQAGAPIKGVLGPLGCPSRTS